MTYSSSAGCHSLWKSRLYLCAESASRQKKKTMNQEVSTVLLSMSGPDNDCEIPLLQELYLTQDKVNTQRI